VFVEPREVNVLKSCVAEVKIGIESVVMLIMILKRGS
jgi:hypothetical protein